MIGAMIGEGNGKRTGRRVVSVSPNLVVEVSFEDDSKWLGLDGMNIGTYISSPRADGSLQGDGQGAFATMSGELVTWKGVGTGKLENGAVSYAGTLIFNTTSASLAALNGVAGAFEFSVAADGTTQSKIWEWK